MSSVDNSCVGHMGPRVWWFRYVDCSLKQSYTLHGDLTSPAFWKSVYSVAAHACLSGLSLIWAISSVEMMACGGNDSSFHCAHSVQ